MRKYAWLLLALATTASAQALPNEIKVQYEVYKSAQLNGDYPKLTSLYAPEAITVTADGNYINTKLSISGMEMMKMKAKSINIEILEHRVEDNRYRVLSRQKATVEAPSPSGPMLIQTDTLSQDTWKKVGQSWLITKTENLEETTNVAGQVTKNVAPKPPTTAEVQARITELNKISVPIQTTAADAQNNDFVWLGDFVKGAMLVGAGEGSHGTAEHFQLKDRLFRELVTKHGFTVFAIEADFDDAYMIDRYVRGLETNDATWATKQFDFWVWQTQEVRDLLAWMRQYNATRGQKPELRVVGVDMQDPAGSLNLLASLAPADVAKHKTVTQLKAFLPAKEPKPEQVKEAQALGMALSEMVKKLPIQTPQRLEIIHLARTVEQGLKMVGKQIDVEMSNIRDHAMHDNTVWMLNEYLPGHKTMLWAHNFHVAKQGAQGQQFITMGQRLKNTLEQKYKVIGFSYLSGTIRAANQANNSARESIAIFALPENSLDDLATRRSANVSIDMQKAMQNSVLSKWFSEKVLFAGIGMGYSSGLSTHYPTDLPKTFDALILTKTSHAAKPLEP